MDWVFQEKLISLFLLPLRDGFKHLFTEQEIRVFWKLSTVSRTLRKRTEPKIREFMPILLRCFGNSCPCMTARLELEKWDVRGRCQSVWLLKRRGMSSGLCNGEHEIQSGLDIVLSMSGFVDKKCYKAIRSEQYGETGKTFFFFFLNISYNLHISTCGHTGHSRGSRRYNHCLCCTLVETEKETLIFRKGWNSKNSDNECTNLPLG